MCSQAAPKGAGALMTPSRLDQLVRHRCCHSLRKRSQRYIRYMYGTLNYQMGVYANNAGFGALGEFPCRSAADARFGIQNSAADGLAKPDLRR